VSLDKLHKIAEKGLRDGLKDLGFDLSNGVSKLTAWLYMLAEVIVRL
jgi:hypothetical protein